MTIYDGDFDFSGPDDDGGGDDDSGTCDECGFDHAMEVFQAQEWHSQNPCTYCVYEFGIGHSPSCPTQFEGD